MRSMFPSVKIPQGNLIEAVLIANSVELIQKIAFPDAPGHSNLLGNMMVISTGPGWTANNTKKI